MTLGKLFIELWKKVKVTQSCLALCNPHGLYSSWNSPGQNTGVGSLSLLQGIFPTQGSNPGLLHCRWILYQLSHKGSPRILEWVAYHFSSRSSLPRNQTRVSCIAGRFFTSLATRDTNHRRVPLYSWRGESMSSVELSFCEDLSQCRHRAGTQELFLDF